MKKIIYNFASKNILFFTSIVIFLLFVGCTPEEQQNFTRNLLSQLGWDSTFIEKDKNEVEKDINLDDKIQNGGFPASYTLINRFPPVGNQGDYGTCVAWAVGYYGRTFLYAQDNNLSASNLTSTSNQFSPKDLFFSIDRQFKGTNCNGSSFDAAFEVIQKRGIAKMSDVPYESLGACTGNGNAWNNLAQNNKIKNYRQIKIDENTFKSHLTQNRAIIIGAKLGNAFMDWNSSAVLTNDNDTYQGQHAYHALAIVGYDDSKQAFRVINSWNTWWGDKGYVWIGYNFMVSKFCIVAYIATTESSAIVSSTNGIVSDGSVRSGMDLQTSYLTDEPMGDVNDDYRSITYDVYNRGNQSIPATLDWSVIYMIYDAFDAENYDILLHDYYSNDLVEVNKDGEWNSATTINEGNPVSRGSSGNWWNYRNIPAKTSIAVAVNGVENFEWEYNLPSNLKDGYYYLVLWADPFNKVVEEDEDNNYLFYTNDDGGPLEVKGGKIVVTSSNSLRRSSNSKSFKEVTSIAPNTYSGEELLSVLKRDQANGRLSKKINNTRFKKHINRK